MTSQEFIFSRLVVGIPANLSVTPKQFFVNIGNTIKESFQWTDTVFRINQVNIVTMNILELDISVGRRHRKRSI